MRTQEVTGQTFGKELDVWVLKEATPNKQVKQTIVAYFASYYMGNSHKMIIDHICEMVCGKAVIFYNYLVVNYTIVKHHLSVHQVLKLSLAFGNLHTDYERLTLRLFLFYLVGVVALGTESIVLRLCILLTSYLNSHFC